MPTTETARSKWALAAFFVVVVTLLPFLHGLFLGQAFYFRDLSEQFFPVRLFVVEGLRQGEVRYWNPYVHEGVPLSAPPIAYPFDLLQFLVPNETGFTLLLALHVPFSALAFLALARRLNLSPSGAVMGATVYALSGFSLSCLNLYVHAQAVAWAPLLVLATMRCAEGGRREVAVAGLLLAVALSTTAVEIVAQAILAGWLLAAPGLDRRRWLRLLGGLAIGLGLAAHTLIYMNGLLGGSAREHGFPTEVVLAHSIHPFTFVQTVVGDLYGELPRIAMSWWGQNFFSGGFPYVLSIYLGTAALAFAFLGAARKGPGRLAGVGLVAIGVLVCLGSYAGLEHLLDLVFWARRFRYPTKAFFSVTFGVAILAARGMDSLIGDRKREYRVFASTAGALGLFLVFVPFLPDLFPALVKRFTLSFFPPGSSEAMRGAQLDHLLSDAAVGGMCAALAGLLGVLVLARRLSPRLARAGGLALVIADLLRTGSGLNPMVTPSFYAWSPEMAEAGRRLRAAGARVFVCEPEADGAFRALRARLSGDVDVWSFGVARETLTPFHNMGLGIPTALSQDRTMLVPEDRVLPFEQIACRDFPAIRKRLRSAGVSHVVSQRKISDPDLTLMVEVAPRRTRPLSISVYTLAQPLPLRSVLRSAVPAPLRAAPAPIAGETGSTDNGEAVIEGLRERVAQATGRILSASEHSDRTLYQVETDRPAVLLVRDAWAPGWSARVDGAPVPVLRANGRHRAIPIPSGIHTVEEWFAPPGNRHGLTLTVAFAILTIGLMLWPSAWWVSAHRRE